MSRELEKRTYDEISLPFEQLDADYIRGTDLHSAVASKPVEEALEHHSVHANFDGAFNDYLIRDDDVIDRILGNFNSGICMEIDPLDQYSHFTAEIIPSVDQSAEEISRELENLEKGIAEYFESIDPTSEYNAFANTSNAVGQPYND